MAWGIASRILRGKPAGAKLIVLGLFMILFAGGIDIVSKYFTGEGSITVGVLVGVGAFTIGVGLANYFARDGKEVEKEGHGED